MNVLANFPYEMFGDREDYPFDRILTFGPPEGRQVGGELFSYDIPFDPGTGSIWDLLQLLPRDFEPDCLVFWWPDQDPLPEGLQNCPVPVVGVLSDYNLTLPYLTRLWPFFDLMLTDTPGVQILGRLPFARVEPWCQFSFRPAVHKIYTDDDGRALDRDVDVCFIGNLNPVVQRTRMPYLDRIMALRSRYDIRVGRVAQGEPYGRMLCRSKIVFNRSIRGEMNLRAFEATAAGALLFMERENSEVRRYFEPGSEIVLYGPGDLEQRIVYYLEHEEERERIARAGHQRVQNYTLPSLCESLPALFSSLNPASRPTAGELTVSLGRAEAMLAGHRDFPACIELLQRAMQRFPASPVAANNCAVALWSRYREAQSPDCWVEHLTRAAEIYPDYLPARLNLLSMFQLAGMDEQVGWMRDEIHGILERDLPLEAFDGLCMAIGFTNGTVTHARALADCLRNGDTRPLADWFRSRVECRGQIIASPDWRPAIHDYRLEGVSPMPRRKAKV